MVQTVRDMLQTVPDASCSDRKSSAPMVDSRARLTVGDGDEAARQRTKYCIASCVCHKTICNKLNFLRLFIPELQAIFCV